MRDLPNRELSMKFNTNAERRKRLKAVPPRFDGTHCRLDCPYLCIAYHATCFLPSPTGKPVETTLNEPEANEPERSTSCLKRFKEVA